MYGDVSLLVMFKFDCDYVNLISYSTGDFAFDGKCDGHFQSTVFDKTVIGLSLYTLVL